jgi:hypothetical protein
MTFQDPLFSDSTPDDSQPLHDFGEKIGGARKDRAVSTGPRAKAAPAPQEAENCYYSNDTWAKRFKVLQTSDVRRSSTDSYWGVFDTKKYATLGGLRLVGERYGNKEAALAAVPLYALALSHRVRSATIDGKRIYKIFRITGKDKAVQVVKQSFASEVDALKYQAVHAVAILNTNTTFGEQSLPIPKQYERIGVQHRQGDVSPQMFMDVFGMRGVEFGNWNNQSERTDVMNAAYDGLMDLSTALHLPPKAMSLGGELALAFGARGAGLSSARAHYEPQKIAINLTKMKGMGALAHEWMHALDHKLARGEGKATTVPTVDTDGTRIWQDASLRHTFITHGFFTRGSNTPEPLKTALQSWTHALYNKNAVVQVDVPAEQKFLLVAKARLEDELKTLRKYLAEPMNVSWKKRHIGAASSEDMAVIDGCIEFLLNGNDLAVKVISNTLPGKAITRLSKGNFRLSNDTLDAMNGILLKVRGHGGFLAGNNGTLDELTRYMRHYLQRLTTIKNAEASIATEKSVPTEYAMHAMSIDQGRGQMYWREEHEMAARAFQAYVRDKLEAKQCVSTFLNYAPHGAVVETTWGDFPVFPQGDEQKHLVAAFDQVMQNIREHCDWAQA